MSCSKRKFRMIYSCRSGVFLPIKNFSISLIDSCTSILTGSRRISSAMKCLNSSGEISPKPLNRVISGFRPRVLMASSPCRHNSRAFSSCYVRGTEGFGEQINDLGELIRERIGGKSNQEADVHSIHIRIGCNYNLIVARSSRSSSIPSAACMRLNSSFS